MNKIAIIKKMPNGRYRLVSKKKDKDGKHRNLGEYDTLEGAKERERQVEYFKHQHAEDNFDVDQAAMDSAIPRYEDNMDNSGYIGGEGVGGSYSLLSVPESTVASYKKTIKIAGNKFDKFITVINNNGNKIIRAGYSKHKNGANLEISKTFNTLEAAYKFIQSDDSMYNLDSIVNSNGLLGNTQLDGPAGGFGGILDPVMENPISNAGDIGSWDFK